MKTKRPSLRLTCLLPVVALLVGACAEVGELDPGDSPASDTPAGVAPRSGAHLMAMPGAQRPVLEGVSHAGRAERAEPADAFARRAQGQGQYNFNYRGGAVIANVKVVNVYWNAGIDNQKALDGFYQSITQSTYLDWLAEYSTPTQTIGRGSFGGSVVDPGAPTSTSLSDADIQQEIGRLLDAGKLPAPDANTLYMVYFPAGVSISMDSNQSCQQFCAYHGSFKKGSAAVYYGVMPDFSGPCASCGGTGDKLQNTTIVAAHELIEAITDPGIGLANAANDGSLLGWYDDQGGEIGDVCQAEAAVVGGWTVQKGYSQQAGQCVATKAEVGGGGGGGSTGSGGGGAPGCTHGVCQLGTPIPVSCGPCTQKVCQADPHCCQSTWDAACVHDAVQICGKHCP